MKIGIDVRCLASGKRTGVEEYTIRLLEQLFAIDQKNSYILFFNAYHKELVDLSWAQKYSHVSISYHRIPNKLLNLSLWYFRWPKIDQMIGGVDLLFLPNVNFCAVSNKSKVVMTLHDLSFERYKRTFSLKHRFWHYFINPKRLCQRADHIITVSEATCNDLAETYAISGSSRVSVIHNGVEDISQAPFSDEANREVNMKFSLPEEYILYFGTIEPRKNITAIIYAYEHIRNKEKDIKNTLKLVVAGNEGWKGKEVMKMITSSTYAEDIIVTGAVSEEEKGIILNNAKIFLYPSLYEGFGFPPLEAGAAHIPAITSHTSSLPELVGPYAIMVDPLRSDEVATALQSLLTDPDLYKYIATSAKINTHNFIWGKSAKKTRNIFTKVVA